jgi:hypothetical protein
MSSNRPGREISRIVCQISYIVNPHRLPSTDFTGSSMFTQPVKNQLRDVETPPAIAAMQCCRDNTTQPLATTTINPSRTASGQKSDQPQKDLKRRRLE